MARQNLENINSEIVTCRRILDFMVISCFMIHHIIRVNIAIAIVEMIAKNNTNTSHHGPRFNWDEEQKNNILGWFFWGYLITEVPGGRLAEIFGTKIILGTSMFIAALLTLLTPFACNFHYYWVVAIRVCLGLAMGVQWPSVPPMATKWVPPLHVSKFMSHMIASSLGIGLILPVCGYLIAYWGWPSVFYVTGTMALVWSIGWFYLVYDSPRQHPRISNNEKQQLEKTIVCSEDLKQKEKTPWRKILTSKPVWAIVVANTCGAFSFFVIMNQLPSYLDQVLHYNIKQNGLLSSLPYVARYVVSVMSGYMADRLRRTGKLSTTTVRKLFTTVDLLGGCFLFLIQVFWGYDRVIAIIVFTGILCLRGFSTAGYHSNTLDISPTYSGTIYGIANACSCIPGYVTTKIVAYFTKEQQTFEQWIYIFWILIGVNLIGAIFYIVYASGDIQNWNSKEDELETEKLRKNGEDKVLIQNNKK